jgi:glycosyltransferase involved in cell wall biosynthesis
MTPAITIVCLCYNHERYVVNALRSLLGQSRGDFEIVVIDDGSTDNSVSLIRGIDDPRLRLITQENHGPGYASSRAVAEARGSYIALMSADDLCPPHRLEAQVAEMTGGALDVHFSRPALIDEHDRPLPDTAWPVFFKRRFSSQEDLYWQLFFKGNFLCATSAMLRREVIDRFGWVHNGMLQLQDFLLWVRLAPHCRFGVSEDRLLMYRVRNADANLSSRSNAWRTIPEKSLIYRRFFDGAPRDFVLRAFPELAGVPADLPEVAYQAHLSLLYLGHKNPDVRMIGVERLIALMEKPGDYDVLRKSAMIDVKAVYEKFSEALPELREDGRKSSRGKPRMTAARRLLDRIRGA